jgi:hypothetical protein
MVCEWPTPVVAERGAAAQWVEERWKLRVERGCHLERWVEQKLELAEFRRALSGVQNHVRLPRHLDLPAKMMRSFSGIQRADC